MDGAEVFSIDVDAHLDPQVVGAVDVPGAGVAHDFAIARLHEQRPLEERLRKRLESERREELLADAHHPDRIDLARLQVVGQREGLRLARGSDQVVDVRPVLLPEIAEQVRRDRPALRHGGAVLVVQLRADVGVQRKIERPELLPETIQFLREGVRRHVVLAAPHRTGVLESERGRALVRQLNEPDVILPHRRRDGVPSLPDFEQPLRVSVLSEDLA